MPSRQLHTPFLERAGGDTADGASQLALGAFLTLRAVDAVAQAETGSESLTYQLDALDQFLGELAGECAERDRLTAIATALAGASGGEFEPLWTAMLDYEDLLEGDFRLDEAIDVVQTAIACATRDPAALPKLELRHGRPLRISGDLTSANRAYERAGELALAENDSHLHRLSRIGRAMVLQNAGNLPAAEELLVGVVEDGVRANDLDAQARGSHDLAVNHIKRGNPKWAVPLAFRAYSLYETDEMRYRAIGDLGMALSQLGHLTAARDAQEFVAAGPVAVDMRITAQLELLDITAAMQDRMSFERIRREVAKLESSLPPDWAADFYLKLGRGFRDFGQRDLARSYLEKTIEFASQHDVHQYAFEAERALQDITLERVHQPSAPSPQFDSEVVEIAEKLHHLRVP